MYGSIVVGTDGSPTAIEALGRAAALAKALSSTLHVVSAYKGGAAAAPTPDVESLEYGDWRLGVRGDIEVMLAGVRRRLSAEGVKVEVHAVADHPVAAILRVADECVAELVVVGNMGMRGPKRVLGSVPNSISHQAGCDVLIVQTT